MRDITKKIQISLGKIKSVEELPDARPWSTTWRIVLEDSRVVYLKRNPRTRHEAEITKRLNDLAPEMIPRVLMDDVDPSNSECWFVLEDVGNSLLKDKHTTTKQLQKITFTIGSLQRKIADSGLKLNVPDLSPDTLETIIETETKWAKKERFNPRRLKELTPTLNLLPSTILHGDFEVGNIAYTENAVRFIDWADALWGPPATVLIKLSDREAQSWDDSVLAAYSRGLGQSLPIGYVEACKVVGVIMDIVVDAQMARSVGRGPSSLPALTANFERLISLVK